MDTPTDRTNRTILFQFRSRDLLWILTLGFVTNFVTIGYITFGSDAAHLPMAFLIIMANLFTIIGGVDGMDDFKAIIADYDEEEAKTHMGKRLIDTPWIMFKGLVTILFGGLAILQLYAMYA